VTSVVFGFSGESVASGSKDGAVIVYNTATGQGCSPLKTSSNQVQSVSQLLGLCVQLTQRPTESM